MWVRATDRAAIAQGTGGRGQRDGGRQLAWPEGKRQELTTIDWADPAPWAPRSSRQANLKVGAFPDHLPMYIFGANPSSLRLGSFRELSFYFIRPPYLSATLFICSIC